MEPLGLIEGAWVVTPRVHRDHRGSFHEWFRGDEFAGTAGYRFPLSQANCSVSHRGVLRGIHFAEVPPGQAKYVICPAGVVMDVVVNLRTGSPGYGHWEAVTISGDDHRAVVISEGLGHAFMALSASATVVYLCSAPYSPPAEHTVHALDPAIGIRWPQDVPVTLSDRDAAAPSLAEAAAAGLLPGYPACAAQLARARGRPPGRA